MNLFCSIAAAAAAIAASFITANPAEADQKYYSTCSITRISTGKTSYRKCNHEGARMLDGRHQVTRIYLDNGVEIYEDGRLWDYYGPDCLKNSKDYKVCIPDPTGQFDFFVVPRTEAENYYNRKAERKTKSSIPFNGRRCTYIVNYLHQIPGKDCGLWEGNYKGNQSIVVDIDDNIFQLNLATGKLYINTQYHPGGNGNYSSSIIDGCSLFIPTSDSRPGTHPPRRPEDYETGICVSH